MGKLYTEKEVAEMLRLSVYTVRDWRSRPGQVMLKYIKVGRSVRYEEREILRYLEKRRQG